MVEFRGTRAETALVNGRFGDAVIRGLRQTTPADSVAVALARTIQSEMRSRVGYEAKPRRILTPGASQHKLDKNTLPSFGLMLTPERGLMSAPHIMAAYGLTGAWNLCPRASRGCAAVCLSRSGQSGMPAQQRAQMVRTAFLLSQPYYAGLIIGAELRAAIRRHGRINLRLNTTSDIRWEIVAPEMVRALSDAGVVLYDYTAWKPADRKPSADYALTYSAKEPENTPDDYLAGLLAEGNNVAMPFAVGRGAPLPASWHGFPVIDGDLSDERRNDPAGVVVGLRAKGWEWKRPGGNSAGFIRTV